MSESRGDVDLVGHNVIFIKEPNVGPLPAFNNVLVHPKDPEHKWLEPATYAIGEWRAKPRSTYIRWSLAINGLDVAAKRYGSADWPRSNGFVVTSLRPIGDGKRDSAGRVEVDVCTIAKWDGPTAAAAHRKTMPMLAAFGIIDMFANLEEFVFALYRIFLNHKPDSILEGDEFRTLRQLRVQAAADLTKRPEWDKAWEDRLNAWQRKKLYQGLGKVFKAFCTQAGLKAPSFYTTTAETWAETIEIIALVRNSLIHGASTVSLELAQACEKRHAILFDFKKDDPLVIHTHHLQGVDCFCDQLLDALNVSMVEIVQKAAKS